MLPILLLLSVVATFAALAWLISEVRRMQIGFASPFDRVPRHARSVPLPAPVRRAARALAAALLLNGGIAVALAF